MSGANFIKLVPSWASMAQPERNGKRRPDTSVLGIK